MAKKDILRREVNHFQLDTYHIDNLLLRISKIYVRELQKLEAISKEIETPIRKETVASLSRITLDLAIIRKIVAQQEQEMADVNNISDEDIKATLNNLTKKNSNTFGFVASGVKDVELPDNEFTQDNENEDN